MPGQAREYEYFRGSDKVVLRHEPNRITITAYAPASSKRSKVLFDRTFLHVSGANAGLRIQRRALLDAGWLNARDFRKQASASGVGAASRKQAAAGTPRTLPPISQFNVSQYRDAFGAAWTTLLKDDRRSGACFDPVFVFAGGAAFESPPTKAHWTVRGKKAVVVTGDLDLTGVVEVDTGARLVVLGNLACRDLVTAGSTYVLGNLRVARLLYCVHEQFETHVYGKARVATLLCDRNHQYMERGKKLGDRSARLHLWDEQHGYDAITRYLKDVVGLRGSDLAAHLRKTAGTFGRPPRTPRSR